MLVLALALVAHAAAPDAPTAPADETAEAAASGAEAAEGTTDPEADAQITLATAPPAPDPDPPVDAEALTAFLDAHASAFGAKLGEEFAFSGFIHVTDDGQPIYSKGFGLADRETGKVPDARTTYRIGSTTKQFAAVVLLRLAEQGRLDLSDPVSKYVDGPFDDITIEQVLSHTSGVWSYTESPEMMDFSSEMHTTEELVARFADAPRTFAPGTDWAYSNSGYVLAGAIIEAITEEPWEKAVQTWALEPAGIRRIAVLDQDTGNDAVGYSVDAGAIVLAPPVHRSVPHAAGNLSANAEAMVAWHEALQGDALLSEASKARMNTAVRNDYGLGVEVRQLGDAQAICHGGGIMGFTHFYCRVPDRDLVVVAWSNQDAFNAAQIGDPALAAALGAPVQPYREPAPADPAKDLTKGISGKWRLTDASRTELAGMGVPDDVLDAVTALSVKWKKGRATLTSGLPEASLVAVESEKFVDPRSQLWMGLEGEQLVLSQGGARFVYSRS